MIKNLSLIGDLVELWPTLTANERKTYFFSLEKSLGEELFLSLSAPDQKELLLGLSNEQVKSWIRFLPPDDAADFIQHHPEEQRKNILSFLDTKRQHEVLGLLAYAEDAAGGLMTSEYIRLRPDMSVTEAIGYLRAQAKSHIKSYYTYVLDPNQILLGIISIREILFEPNDRQIRDIMNKDFIFVTEDMSSEDVARVFAKNSRLLAVPVIDKAGTMKGIVTHDDIAWVVEKAATEDIQKIGGMEALDAPYFNVSFIELLKKRAGWLMALFIGEMLTATAMGYFEDEIAKAVVLALFIPLIISSGGNSGSQASTLIVRSLALYEMRLKDWWRVFFRELGFGLAFGTILGSVGLLRIIIWQQWHPLYGEHYLLIAFTVAFSLLGVVLWGTISGAMLPFLLRYLKFDPASASAPLVATIVDVTGLIIYFTVASIFLTDVLL